MLAETALNLQLQKVDELMIQVIIHVKREHKEIELNTEDISKIKPLVKEIR